MIIDSLFTTILKMSFAATVVVLIVLAARLLLKKLGAPSFIAHLLWLVVLFRLLCPLAFDSAASVFSLPFLDQSLTKIETMTNAETATAGTIPDTSLTASATPNSSNPVATSAPPASDAVAASTSAAGPSIELIEILSIIWLLGVMAFIIYAIVSSSRLKRRLQSADHLYGRVYESHLVPGPFVYGLIHPRIYLPTEMRSDERAYILAHEKSHIHRFDHLTKPLYFLALAIHWFNPLVWVAYRLMDRDMEMACDERVIRQMGIGSQNRYGRLLLSFATTEEPFPNVPVAFGESNGFRRIKNILHYKKPALGAGIAGIILCLSVVAVTATDPIPVDETLQSSATQIATEDPSPLEGEATANNDGQNLAAQTIDGNKTSSTDSRSNASSTNTSTTTNPTQTGTSNEPGKSSQGGSYSQIELENLYRLAQLTPADITNDPSLQQLQSLQQLDLKGQYIASSGGYQSQIGREGMEIVASLGNLLYLSFTDLNISDVSILSKLPNLERLTITDSGTCVFQITSVTGFKSLNTLAFYTITVPTLQGIDQLPSLRTLTLSYTRTTNISPLADAANLETLYAPGIGVASLEPLAKLTRLTWLDVSDSSISSIAPLANLTGMETLGLSYTKVSDISPLANMANLKTLTLEGTPVQDFSTLASLKSLTSLNVYGTAFAAQDLAYLKSATQLKSLYLPKTLEGDSAVSELQAALPQCYIGFHGK